MEISTFEGLSTPPLSETEWGQESTYRKDQRDTSPYSLRAVQVSLGAKEEILLALAFPGDNSGAIQKYLNRFACRKTGGDPSIVLRDRYIWSGNSGGDWDGRGFLGTVHVVLGDVD